MFLREAARRRGAPSRLLPQSLSQRERVPYRHDGSSFDSRRRISNARSLRRADFNLEEYMSRRNPSYYPPRHSRSPGGRNSRFPVPGRRGPVQLSFTSDQKRRFIPKRSARPHSDISYSKSNRYFFNIFLL